MTPRKAIFISGGGSGIGRATAILFASKGWFVGLADVSAGGMSETVALLPPGQSSTHLMDVRDRAAWKSGLADFWLASGGRLDVLFNNAGIARGGMFGDVSDVDHDMLIDINFKGVVSGRRPLCPISSKQRDHACLTRDQPPGFTAHPA